ncbi:uncharacterized protein B0H18DRAFT_975495 [Fomitopsis serialis]|uniref:uncharacterized protein n=1 Tax=Fomitopsis serialis TaxID=139415 RepID=UPI0020087339|nr:uncharacterized protein B0H18DRAFT_975495 [Neoantrodia serialis]KAH9935353.1 hypothetical protein B0H18DRAFT_975495 [Neoantrodia serialis]
MYTKYLMFLAPLLLAFVTDAASVPTTRNCWEPGSYDGCPRSGQYGCMSVTIIGTYMTFSGCRSRRVHHQRR